MDEKTVMDALVQMKRTGNLLNEMWDLTQQLGQSIDRSDQVSIQMLIAMREEPLTKLQEADQAIREQLEALPDRGAAAQLAAMLNGGAAADPAQQSPIAGALALIAGILLAWRGASLFVVAVACCLVVLGAEFILI